MLVVSFIFFPYGGRRDGWHGWPGVVVRVVRCLGYTEYIRDAGFGKAGLLDIPRVREEGETTPRSVATKFRFLLFVSLLLHHTKGWRRGEAAAHPSLRGLNSAG
jgi:hypothetical protein